MDMVINNLLVTVRVASFHDVLSMNNVLKESFMDIWSVYTGSNIKFIDLGDLKSNKETIQGLILPETTWQRFVDLGRAAKARGYSGWLKLPDFHHGLQQVSIGS